MGKHRVAGRLRIRQAGYPGKQCEIAGTEVGEPNAAKIDGTDVELWDRIMEVNSKGVFLGTRAAIPAMRAAGGGSIINISSIAAIVALASGSGRFRRLLSVQGVSAAAH